jgi:hypothetical protein
MGASHDVDGELARMKAELGQGSAPRELEGSAGPAEAEQAPTTAAQPVDHQQAGEGQ